MNTQLFVIQDNTVAGSIPLPRTADGTLSAEADHRIGNNLALVAATLRLQAAEMTKRKDMMAATEVRGILSETAGRIEAVGKLHRLLATAGDEAVIDVADYIREITDAMVRSVVNHGAAMVAYDLADACRLHANQALPIGLIVGEIVSNAIKYAHPTGLPTALSVRCSTSDGQTVIEIADDGVGMPEGFDPARHGGLGLRLVRSLADQIGATATFENRPLGLRVRLAIPS